MNYVISADTDKGIRKETNQDSLSVKLINTPFGKAVFAIMCDGMGGLEKGELASATVVEAYNEWLLSDFPSLCQNGIDEDLIIGSWELIAKESNRRIMSYGCDINANIGTTAAVMLITEEKYIVMNVGDSRIYEIFGGVRQITKDQTVVAREIELGRLTPEQAYEDPRRSVLLQCIGASETLEPEFFIGKTVNGAVYILCSDGFVHEIAEEEMLEAFSTDDACDSEKMKRNIRMLIELNKARLEQDNISVIAIRTY